MNNAQWHLSSCDSRFSGFTRVYLAVIKTDSESAWQCRNRKETPSVLISIIVH